MKNNISVGIICLLVSLISCKSEKDDKLTENSFPVIIEEFSQSKFHHADTTTLTIRQNDSINIHLFGLNKDGEYETIQDFIFEINQRDQSRILIDKNPSKFISEKKYSFGNENLVVRKYYYDIANVADEEGFFFIAKNRIIAYNSTAWNLKRFYKYEKLDIDHLLKKDTTDFFYCYKNERILE